MALDINNIVAASVKSKNVATEEYSDSGIAVVTDNIYKTGTTTIDGGKIVTGSVQADVLKAGTSGATMWTGGGLVSSNFDGSVSGDIGTPTAGFRMSSDAAGTAADPSIYGAYIKGGTLDGGTIIGTTIKLSDLVVTTDADLSAKPSFVTSWSLVTSPRVGNLDIEAYNAVTSINGNRLKSSSGNILELLGTNTVKDLSDVVYIFPGWIVLNPVGANAVRIWRGDTLIETIGTELTGEFTGSITGITIETFNYYGYDTALLVKQINVLNNFSGEGALYIGPYSIDSIYGNSVVTFRNYDTSVRIVNL